MRKEKKYRKSDGKGFEMSRCDDPTGRRGDGLF